MLENHQKCGFVKLFSSSGGTEFFVLVESIQSMERFAPKSVQSKSVNYSSLVTLTSGKIIYVKESPEDIFKMILDLDPEEAVIGFGGHLE
jgi:hypothetical protein